MKRIVAWLIVAVLVITFLSGPIALFFTWIFSLLGMLFGSFLGILSVALVVFVLVKEGITSALPLAAVMTLLLCVGFAGLAFHRNQPLLSDTYAMVLVLFLVGAGLSSGVLREQLEDIRLSWRGRHV